MCGLLKGDWGPLTLRWDFFSSRSILGQPRGGLQIGSGCWTLSSKIDLRDTNGRRLIV